jgi:hypothetical protein
MAEASPRRRWRSTISMANGRREYRSRAGYRG